VPEVVLSSFGLSFFLCSFIYLLYKTIFMFLLFRSKL
jgi:hypothetical protein